ncbi:ADC synthase [Westerdykella ornata]|uniref:aminodeoxychorismate synthase n=1 Tax=Westerdykella ornata TaxID=318751 RepID=A0A6A6JC78_WESOR|nr:ADC synthase [Westerdykella ornata]KAF2274220.1 ADC synthase [Westerdykella ornata]
MAPALLTRKPRILYLDAYDSFSNNIVAQVTECLDAEVTQIRIDDIFSKCLRRFDAVIAGPGPGWATEEKDVGLMKELWELQDEDLLPVLGICLGFQSMTLAFGAKMKKLKEPQHGLIHDILHKESSIFRGLDQLLATQYHSLHVDIGHNIQANGAVSYPGELWATTEQCPFLEPLAWDFDNARNGAVLMAAKHTEKPFWGVQFHPESICTNEEGSHLIKNWWSSAESWCYPEHSLMWDTIATAFGGRLKAEIKDGKTLPRALRDRIGGRVPEVSNARDFAGLIGLDMELRANYFPPPYLQWLTTGSGRLTVADVCEAFDIPRGEAIVLESGLQPNFQPFKVGTGRYSIIGLVPEKETIRILYTCADRTSQSGCREGTLELQDGQGNVLIKAMTSTPWEYIKAFMRLATPIRTPIKANPAPFWGGLMGYATYESGLETIDVDFVGKSSYPDICFAYVTRSIVLDHFLKKAYVQSTRLCDRAWLEGAREKIYNAAALKSFSSTPNLTPLPKPDPFDTDTTLNEYLWSCKQHVAEQDAYCKLVENCQEYIANGHSYELCLTTQNKITAKRPLECRHSQTANNELSWKLYKRMTSRNPAPFSAYVRLGNVHILSSSPERYICWDRKQKAQCRPIKGTVQKRPGVTAEDAHAILSSSKERAENLMIVDLVRHQLHGVYGAGNVKVSQLMQVEEYETLWQLVSVIDAIPAGLGPGPGPGTPSSSSPEKWHDASVGAAEYAPPDPDDASSTLGFEAFIQSLPAGSMTGAPKKRSCEILQSQERAARRGVYSGVIGYLDFGGAGDFSVVIRTAVKVDKAAPESTSEEEVVAEEEEDDEDEWLIGAGGAITSQSDPASEYDEMLGKFRSASRAFQMDSSEAAGDASGAREKPALADVLALLDRGISVSAA